jgi:hypothetical protein
MLTIPTNVDIESAIELMIMGKRLSYRVSNGSTIYLANFNVWYF